mmetsp:Transcript_28923/g.49303  ORF Transcript_28923/g.49303 Transcript_28923/m.49303 type:complete len:253 (-) Transcript_28923:850-1608(-)
MECTATADNELISSVTRLNLQGQISFQFLIQAIFDVAACDVLAFFASKRGRVDHESHPHSGIFHLDGWQGLGVALFTNGLTDRDVRQTTDSTNISGRHDLDVFACEVVVDIQLPNLAIAGVCLGCANGNAKCLLDHACLHTSESNAALVHIIIQVGHQHLQWLVRLSNGCRDMLDDGVEQGYQIVSQLTGLIASNTAHSRGKYHGEIQLFVTGVQLHKQIPRDVDHPFRVHTIAVHFVHHYAHLFAESQGLL